MSLSQPSKYNIAMAVLAVWVHGVSPETVSYCCRKLFACFFLDRARKVNWLLTWEVDWLY